MLDYFFVTLIIVTLLVLVTGCGTNPANPTVPPLHKASAETGELLKTVGWIPSLCLIAIGLSIIAIYNGSKGAIGVLLGAATTLSLSFALSEFSAWLGIAGLLFLGAGLVLVAVTVWTKNRAITEVVGNVQKIKELTGPPTEVRAILGTQSSTTAKVVRAVKRKLPKAENLAEQENAK